MASLLADESLKGHYIRYLRQRDRHADILTSHEAGLRSTDDRLILEWAAEHDRVLVSPDVKTMIGFAYERIDAGLKVSGLIVVQERLQVPLVVNELLLILGASETNEWENQVRYLPL